jgi:hypothetical protein
MGLSDYRHDVTSQYGEDGIIARIFEVLEIPVGACVEFGAWDGKIYSNTYNLIQNRGWRGVLIEGSARKFVELQRTYAGRKDVETIYSVVGFEPPHLLDEILSKTSIPTDYDLLSIDVDGIDYHILASITRYRPKVVVIEFNPSIPNHIRFIQPRDMQINQGSSAAAITELASQMGYELICCTDVNAFFVERRFFPRFEIADNSLEALNQSRAFQTVLFQGFDGTLHLAGYRKLIWHGIDIDVEKIQVLPKHLRRYPDAL